MKNLLERFKRWADHRADVIEFQAYGIAQAYAKRCGDQSLADALDVTMNRKCEEIINKYYK